MTMLEGKEKKNTKITNPMVPELYEVIDLIKETQDTFTLSLKPKNKTRAFLFKPGQFNMLYVFGVGEIPISICGNKQTCFHTIKSVGMVTKTMEGLKIGDTVGLRGPFGSAWPIEKCNGKDVIVVAGGIGLAPLRPVIYEISNKRKSFKNVHLLYGTRSPEDILYKSEFSMWKSKFNINTQVTVDRPNERWNGNVGVVTPLISQLNISKSNTIAMICGPEIMIRFTIQALENAGLSPKNIYISMERNMKCAVGLCGHCQFGPSFICKEGPVYQYEKIKWLFTKREI